MGVNTENNEIQNILCEVKNVVFPNLKVLNLRNFDITSEENKIASIEILGSIMFPTL